MPFDLLPGFDLVRHVRTTIFHQYVFRPKISTSRRKFRHYDDQAMFPLMQLGGLGKSKELAEFD